MKNYSYAENLFRRGSEIQPDDAGAFMNLGRALKALDRLEEAETVGNEYLRSPVYQCVAVPLCKLVVCTCVHTHVRARTHMHIYTYIQWNLFHLIIC